jgi:hypothetical protein
VQILLIQSASKGNEERALRVLPTAVLLLQLKENIVKVLKFQFLLFSSLSPLVMAFSSAASSKRKCKQSELKQKCSEMKKLKTVFIFPPKSICF